jgi:hypothetical protein
MFNKGEDGFEDRDLYVWCANASDGSAVPRSVNGYAECHRGNDKRDHLLVAAPWHRQPLEKTALYTKVGDQICHYKE